MRRGNIACLCGEEAGCDTVRSLRIYVTGGGGGGGGGGATAAGSDPNGAESFYREDGASADGWSSRQVTDAGSVGMVHGPW